MVPASATVKRSSSSESQANGLANKENAAGRSRSGTSCSTAPSPSNLSVNSLVSRAARCSVPKSPLKATRLPSGEKVGNAAQPTPPAKRRARPPFAGMTQRSPSPNRSLRERDRSETKTMLEPSGDQLGCAWS